MRARPAHGDQGRWTAMRQLMRCDPRATVGRTVTPWICTCTRGTLSRVLLRGNPGGEMPCLITLTDADVWQVGEGSRTSAPRGPETGSTWGEGASQPVPSEPRNLLTARWLSGPPDLRLGAPTTTSLSCSDGARIRLSQATDSPYATWPIRRKRDATTSSMAAWYRLGQHPAGATRR